MSDLRIDAHVDAESWNNGLRELHGTIFHTAEWARHVQAESASAQPEFATLVAGDRSTAGQALLFRSRSSHNLAASFTGSRWLDALPIVRDNSAATLSRFVALIESHARHAGDVTFQVGSFASPRTEAVLRPLGFSLTQRLEFELDLTSDEKTLWEGMEPTRRRNIKKAMRAGVEVKELPGKEGVSQLRRLQAASFERIARRGGPPFVRLDSSQPDPTECLTRAGLGRVVGGFVDGVCVSASFFTTFNDLAYDALLGHDERAYETQAPSLVIWEMARRFKAEGIQRLNLGGCNLDARDKSSPEHGVYAYKKAFGGAVLECANGKKVLRPAIRRASDLLKAAMR